MLQLSLMEYILDTTNYKTFRLIDNRTYVGTDAAPTAAMVVAARALPGDVVYFDADMNEFRLVERVKYNPLIGFFEVCSKTIYGMSSRGTPQFLFYPLNTAFPPMIVGYAGKRDANKLAIVRFDKWEDGEKFPRGSLENVLGNAGDYSTELKSLVLAVCPWRDIAVTNGVGMAAKVPTAASREFITSVNNWRTLNVDPDGCRDVDDVFSYRPLEMNRDILKDDIYEIAISIADVSERIEEGSALDFAACERAETIYVGGGAAKPMLPAIFSEDICSLREGGAPRPCVSLVFELNVVTGVISYMRFIKTMVENNKTYTYDTIYDGEADARILRTCAEVCSGSGSADSHEWIEALMVFYNKEAAKLLLKSGSGLLRTHQAAGADPAGIEPPIADVPGLKYLLMNSAAYISTASALASGAPITHSMFGDAAYCHATSPIRRYADLVNQRQLKAALFGELSSKSIQFIEYHLNKRAKEIRRFNRDSLFLDILYKCQEGTSLKGVCIETDSKGDNIKVYIPEWKKIVKIRGYDDAIPGDWLNVSYWFNPGQLRWKDKIVFRVD